MMEKFTMIWPESLREINCSNWCLTSEHTNHSDDTITLPTSHTKLVKLIITTVYNNHQLVWMLNETTVNYQFTC